MRKNTKNTFGWDSKSEKTATEIVGKNNHYKNLFQELDKASKKIKKKK